MQQPTNMKSHVISLSAMQTHQRKKGGSREAAAVTWRCAPPGCWPRLRGGDLLSRRGLPRSTFYAVQLQLHARGNCSRTSTNLLPR